MSISLDLVWDLAAHYYENAGEWAQDITVYRKDAEIVMLAMLDHHLELAMLHRTRGQIERFVLNVQSEPIGLPSGFFVGEVLAAEERIRAEHSRITWAHAPYPKKSVKGKGVFTYPLGPVRADVSEALLYQLQVMGDEIVRLDLVHQLKRRHVRTLCLGKPASDAVKIVERTTGTSTVAHALAYSMAVEQALGLEMDSGVAQCRMIVAELERVYSHLGDLAALAASTGMPIPQMEYLHHKEVLLRLNHHVFGHRYLRGVVIPGGIQAIQVPSAREWAGETIVTMRDDVERMQHDLERTTSFLDRLHGAGIIPQETLDFVRPVGPVGRASQRDCDVRRMRPYLAYADADFEVPSLEDGDAYARFVVKTKELIQSLSLLRRLLVSEDWMHAQARSLTDRELSKTPGVGLAVIEAPRGLLSYRVEVGSDLTIRHLDVSTPSERNWYVVPPAIANKNILQDFPIIDASFGLSVAGWDK